MRKTVILLSIFMVFYLVKFEGYSWNPCSYDKSTGWGTCLAIYCPGGECKVPGEVNVCTDTACVNAILKRNGLTHLEGVYQVTIDNFIKNTTVKKLEVLPSYEFK